MMTEICRRSVIPIILWGIFRNYSCRRKFVPGRTVKLVGTSDAGRSLDESLAYIDHVYEVYKQYGGVQKRDCPWKGMKVLELGPGENFGVALRFIADGAERVVCADKYVIERDSMREGLIYRALLERMSPEQRRRMTGVIDFDGDVARMNSERITYIPGCPAENLSGVYPWAPYDILVSWAVMQYVKNVAVAIRNFAGILNKTSARMLHKIDFRDDGMFSQFGHHPLTFMCLPGRLYGMMTGNLLRPNRWCAGAFEACAKEAGFTTSLFISQLYGMDREFPVYMRSTDVPEHEAIAAAELVEQIYGQLAGPYNNFSVRDMAACGGLLVGSQGGIDTCGGKSIY